MEFLRGLNLHELVARFGPQSEGRVIHILAQVCDSLAEAHALGLIHRDIKPANVFLCRRGGVADCVKVLDFGLVREHSNGEIASVDPDDDLIEGTPWFMPPEAIKGTGKIDPRSDLYSVGGLGYYLLTGQHIFDAETIPEIHEKQLNAAPIPLSQRTSQPISREMEELLLSCLAKETGARPASANELRARLLSLAAAADWPMKARVDWWDTYEHQLPATPETAADASTPMVTVRIDLVGRGQQ
jgi:serine/threonine protein kinase